jgi:hypothetical protein
MERGAGHWRLIMTSIEVRAAVKQQADVKRQSKLVYRGVPYNK